jgi:N-succinyldiaminopimelate aminotransferase
VARDGYLIPRLEEYTSTIFAEMSALAVATDSINLGQGFPDTDGPDAIKEAAITAIREGHNQYPPGIGIPALRTAIADHQQRCYGLQFDPDSEVLVTAGATEAIAASLLALCDTGDEVVMFEPYYDSYSAGTALAGARRRVVNLRAPDWSFDFDELRRAITPRTRVLLLNSPHNPTGKVFSRVELEAIAALCVERDLIVVSDEVYEHLVFDGEHIPIASLPGMRERTVTISSAGKTFSLTGWKVGWACATPTLLRAVRTVKQFLTYVSAAPFQHAIAAALADDGGWIASLSADLSARRDRLCSGLSAIGFDVSIPSGTYFATTDIRSIGEKDGVDFCRTLPERCGVVAIPSAVFYDDKEAGAPLVRWAFCKRIEVLDAALDRLQLLAR